VQLACRHVTRRLNLHPRIDRRRNNALRAPHDRDAATPGPRYLKRGFADGLGCVEHLVRSIGGSLSGAGFASARLGVTVTR
jgi:hypothetical protein